jgi:hypothetical protein
MSDKENQEKSQEEERISWHPAFFEAIQMELKKYSHDLQFISEYQLTTEPQRIDVVIIKKKRDIVIKKNIASIFRKDNIVEYKSPDDYFSIGGFYKVYGYACSYQYLKSMDIRDITLTFVGSRNPRDILAHLEKERGYKVEEKWPGIYIISGDIMPVQIINSRRLLVEENLWLKELGNKIGMYELELMIREYNKEGKEPRLGAYFDVIKRANSKNLMKEKKMSDALIPFVELFEEAGLFKKWEDQWEAKGIAKGEARGIAKGEARGIARGEARGEERKAADIARNLLKNGFSPEKTAELSGLDISKVITLSKT